jgi:hypothetical protein
MISPNCTIGQIFYEGTLDDQRYINEILNPFFVNFTPAEERFSYFTQDGATPHTQLRKLSKHYVVCLAK